MGPPTTFYLSVFVLDTVWCQYSLVERGQKYSEDESRPYRIYFESPAGDLVSSWHDIPLYSSQDNTDSTYNMIIEIPRFSQAKFEISREMKLNPIVQDLEDSKPRGD